MLGIKTSRTSKVRHALKAAVVIDCISNVDSNFITLFRTTLTSIALERRVLVQLKRATIGDSTTLGAMAAALDARRIAGGQAVFVAATVRARQLLRRNGVPDDMVVSDTDNNVGRWIILAEHSKPLCSAAG